jgi:hypothetical protein
VLVDLFYEIDLGATVIAIVLAVLCFVIVAPHDRRLLDAILLPTRETPRNAAAALDACRATL